VDERVRPVGLATAGPAGSLPASPGARAVLEARGIYKIFVPRGGSRTRAMTALRDVSLDVRPGEFLTLIGPSGCGKSTVLNMFAGLTAPTEGEILHDGRAVQGVNTRVGYVTRLGGDSFGRVFRELWAEEAVDLRGVAIDADAATGVYFVTHGA